MMFGHDEHQNQDNTGPMPDETLGHDMPTALPPADNTATAPATPTSDDSAGDFIMGDDHSTNDASSSTPAGSDDLINIKQQALQQLSPLLGHLQQSPEERFRTTMMLIQASDNDKLIPQAYEAAKAITDEKVRAQALLDVVNEINYFTQSQSGGDNSEQ